MVTSSFDLFLLFTQELADVERFIVEMLNTNEFAAAHPPRTCNFKTLQRRLETRFGKKYMYVTLSCFVCM